jgi:hypothetical protein
VDHIVYLDAKAKEMENLLRGKKSMVIRGAAGRKMPYGRVEVGDALYFINNNAEGLIKAKALVKNVYNSEKMTREESLGLVERNQDKLRLTEKQFKRWAGKRYIVLVAVGDVVQVESFAFDKSDYGNMDDWLPVGDIESVKV